MSFDFNNVHINQTSDCLHVPRLKAVSPRKAAIQKFNLCLPKPIVYDGPDVFGNRVAVCKLSGAPMQWSRMLKGNKWREIIIHSDIVYECGNMLEAQHAQHVLDNLVENKIFRWNGNRSITSVYFSEDLGMCLIILDTAVDISYKLIGVLLYTGAQEYEDLEVTPEDIIRYFEENDVNENFDFGGVDFNDESVIDDVSAIATGLSADANIE